MATNLQSQVAEAMENATRSIAAGEDFVPAPAEQAVVEQAPAGPSWQQNLAAMMPVNAGAAPQTGEDWNASLIEQIKNEAATKQDQTMAAMFGDVLPAKRRDSSALPAAVDRYLDKVLS